MTPSLYRVQYTDGAIAAELHYASGSNTKEQEQRLELFTSVHQAILYCKQLGVSYTVEVIEVGGTKSDADKLPLDLLDPTALEGLAAVLRFGATKYAAHNWRKGISYSRLLAALLRHSFAILKGEYTDPESNLPHIDHIGCCWMFLSNMMKTRTDLDDIHKLPQQPVNN